MVAVERFLCTWTIRFVLQQCCFKRHHMVSTAGTGTSQYKDCCAAVAGGGAHVSGLCVCVGTSELYVPDGHILDIGMEKKCEDRYVVLNITQTPRSLNPCTCLLAPYLWCGTLHNTACKCKALTRMSQGTKGFQYSVLKQIQNDEDRTGASSTYEEPNLTCVLLRSYQQKRDISPFRSLILNTGTNTLPGILEYVTCVPCTLLSARRARLIVMRYWHFFAIFLRVE